MSKGGDGGLPIDIQGMSMGRSAVRNKVSMQTDKLRLGIFLDSLRSTRLGRKRSSAYCSRKFR